PSDWQRAARSVLGDGSLDLEVDVPLGDGAPLDGARGRWVTLYTPGHASTQVCLYDPAGQDLLSSDHLLPAVSTHMLLDPPAPAGPDLLPSAPLLPAVSTNMVLEPPAPGRAAEPPILSFLASLRRLTRLGVGRVWPGHGEPFEDGLAVIAGRIERCEQRLDQV